MSQVLVAPATVAPGSIVYFADSTSAAVGADSTITVPNNSVSALLDAGFTYAASTNAQTSTAQSAAVSAGAADAISRSSATSGGLADSVSRSEAISAGTSASVARSSITSGTV